MRHLLESYKKNRGIRGVTFYDDETCNFLPWDQVLKFIHALPGEAHDLFSDKLEETLANYDPDKEFLAVYQHGTSVSVELYSVSRGLRR